MPDDPHARPSWDATPPPWPAQPSPGYGPPPGSYAPGPYAPGPHAEGPYAEGPYAQGPHGQGPYAQGPYADERYPPGGPETLQYAAPPGTQPPGTQPPGPPPQGGFAWRDGAGPPPPPPRRVSGLLIALLAIAALLAAGVAAYFLVPRPTATATPPPAAAPAPSAPAAVPAAPPSAQPSALTITATADCVSPPSRDASGAVVDYGPERMVDGRADTAWRCDGNGNGKTIKVTFSSPARVVGVGMIPGYAKIDPADGTDRYAQNRRIAQVRYTFDDGTTVEQTLATDAGDRAVQTVPVPGVTSSGMTVTIVRSVPGAAVGANRASDRIAVSELSVLAGG